MKIYTKTGDKGTTALVGGTRVPKQHSKVEAYGTVDELIASVGVVRSYDINPHYKEILLNIQACLMVAAALIASDEKEKDLPQLKAEDVELLEREIDSMDSAVPPLRSFILPGGCLSAAFCHTTRTICRRAERTTLRLIESHTVPESVLQYLNRLSDYFFMLGRKLQHDEGVKEDLWLPTKS